MSVAARQLFAFDNSFVRELEGLYVPWQGQAWPAPELLILNEPLARELGADPAALRSADGVAALAGSRAPDGAAPVAQAYAGHQFGGFVPRLGDGRALLLGEVIGAGGGRRDLHLKGSGRTPFARGGDGKAAVGPMLREYVIGEAMHALGIPTTRALAVVATGEDVLRETALPGAVLARVGASHIRVGTFQYALLTGGAELVRRLADHAIARHHPAAQDAENRYLALFEAVVEAQASLIAQWMHAGFIHGVMNTDNMAISGETIDYGPCAFIDVFDPETVFSSIDHGGRYAFGNQPAIAQWNLARLGETLLDLLGDGATRDRDRGPEHLPRPLRAPLAARHAGQARPHRRASRRRRADRRPARSACGPTASTTRAACVPSAGVARDRSSPTSPSSTAGTSGGSRVRPRARRWTATTRSTSRATTWSRRR